jgi:quercetin dioxygenase-like cupin family protein
MYKMITAYRLFTGEDGHSHFAKGTVSNHEPVHSGSLSFAESEPKSSFDWHNAPCTQYVLTLSGTLEFEVHGGESFTIRPGVVLIAMDVTGSGHKWKLVDGQPWCRAYVTFGDEADLNFTATND